MPESVPDPAKAYEQLVKNDLLDTIVNMAGQCLNVAFETASSEVREGGKIFSPQNWIKAKGSLKDIRSAVKNQLGALKVIPGGKELVDRISEGLRLESGDFEGRWTAD